MMKFMNKFSYLKIAAALLALGLGDILTHPAAIAADYFSPRSAALAGAGIAGPLLNDSLYLNPSFSSFLPTYATAFSIGSYGSQSDPIHGRAYSVSIQDGRNEMFQAGVAYTVRQDHSFIHLGVAKSFIQNWGIGLSGKFFFDPKNVTNGQDFSLSNTYVFSPWFQTALIIDNLVSSDKGKTAGLYREVSFGTKYNADKILLLYFDPHYVPDYAKDKLGFAGGVEFVLMTDLFLRFGKSVNANVPHLNIRGDGYGVGLGWVAPRISIDYGLSKTTNPINITTHVLGATAFF